MKTNTTQKLSYIINIFYYSIIAVAAYLFIEYALPWLMPVLIGGGIAFSADGVSKSVCRRVPVQRRKLIATVTVTVFWLIILFLCFAAVYAAVFELKKFYSWLPQCFDTAINYITSLSARYRNIKSGIPAELGAFADRLASSVGTALEAALHGMIMQSADWFKKIPSFFLLAATTVMTSLLTLYNTDRIKAIVKASLTKSRAGIFVKFKSNAVGSVYKLIKAELLISLAVFLLTVTVLIILKIPYAVLTALLITAADLMPVLGVNTVMAPWGIILILGGDTAKGLTIIISGVIISLIKSGLEPKLLGNVFRTNPLIMLLAGYLGFVLFGAAGALISPAAVFFWSAVRSFETKTEIKTQKTRLCNNYKSRAK